MRPLRLELRGFTAFRNDTVVDFTQRHLFAITGPTGAGKSSLLDAITWALYGRVPRVGTQTSKLRSHGAQTMAVQLDFRVGAETFRVSRRIGKTMAVRLEREEAPGNFRPIADKATEVGTEIERVIGLDYNTFTKTVLLPQGEFAAFLQGSAGDHTAILSKLLGLGVYEQMRERAHAQAAGASGGAKALLQQAEHLGDVTPEAIAALEAERDMLAARIETVRAQRERLTLLTSLEREASERARDAATAEAAAAAARTSEAEATAALAGAQQALDAATTHLATLVAERETLAYDVERHQLLRQQAEQLVQRQRARDDLAAAEVAQADAERAVEATATIAAAATATAARQRAKFAQLTAARDSARQRLSDAAALAALAIDLLHATQMQAETERTSALARATEAEERGRTLDTLAAQRADATAALEGADAEAQRATATAATADAERGRAAATLAAATAAMDEANAARERTRREHAAAELRRTLRVGDPCPVCGEPISVLADHEALDLDAAIAAVRSAESALQAARTAYDDRGLAAAAERARADAARSALDAAHARLEAVERAASDAGIAPDALDAERAQTTSVIVALRATADECTRRAADAGERAQALALLRATVPADVPTTADVDLDDGVDAPALLRDALDAYQLESARTQAGEDAQRTADEAVRAATAAHTHAVAVAVTAATAAASARARLDALPGTEHEDGEMLLAALEAAETQAQRHSAIVEAIGSVEQERAAAASRVELRSTGLASAVVDSARLAAVAEDTSAAALAAAEVYAVHWRTLHDVASAPDAEQLVRWADRIARDGDAAISQHALAAARLTQAHEDVARAQQYRLDAVTYERRGALAQALELDLHKNRFIAFVQREAMQVLASEAADRMEHLSRGRYRMRTDGDEFVVIDRLNGDEQRSVKTLSGGETFLASLALALALAERLPQLSGHGATLSLESLFLDEGFGTLDADALDVAIEALELLASERRMIGVISHVPLIAERLPDRIEVVRTGSGSTVRG